MQLALVARNTFRESVRDRVLYNLIFFALLMIASSLFLGELAIGSEQKIIVRFGLSFMRFFGMLIAIFIGIQLVYKEIERRTIYSLLSKPVRRAELIAGKFCGLSMTLGVNSLVLTAGILVTLCYLAGGYSALMASVVPAAYLVFLELLVVTAVALLLSTVTTPVLAAVMTFLVYIAGNFSTDFRTMAGESASAIGSAVLWALYYVLPNLSNFNRIDAAAYGDAIPADHLVRATLYAAAYCGALLALAVFAFERRDFK